MEAASLFTLYRRPVVGGPASSSGSPPATSWKGGGAHPLPPPSSQQPPPAAAASGAPFGRAVEETRLQRRAEANAAASTSTTAVAPMAHSSRAGDALTPPPSGAAAAAGRLAYHSSQPRRHIAPAPSTLVPLPVSSLEASSSLVVGRWLRGNLSQLSGASPALSNELLFRHVLEVTEAKVAATGHASHPIRLAVACAMFHQRLQAQPSPLLEMLFDELVKACYVAAHTGDAPTTELVASALHRLGIEPMSGVETYLCRRPYFEVFERERGRTTALQQQIVTLRFTTAHRAAAVNRCIDNWSRDLVAVVFRTWKHLMLSTQRMVRGLTNVVHRITHRDVLLTHFYAWRGLTLRGKAERSQRTLIDTMEGIQEREALTNVNVVEFSDKLDEARMQVARLRQEKTTFDQRESVLKELAGLSDNRCGSWRNIAIAAVQLTRDLTERLTQPRAIKNMKELGSMADTATAVIMPWVRSQIQHLPGYPGNKKCDNFGAHLKDGAIFTLLVHALTKGRLDLAVLQNPEPTRRLSLALEALRDVDVRIPLKAEDLVLGASDLNFVFLFMLWCRSFTPLEPESAIGSLKRAAPFAEEEGAAATDLAGLQDVLPSWIEHRNALFEYAAYILASRSKGVAVRMAVSDDEKRQLRDSELFSIKTCAALPEVFVDFEFMSAEQRAANEEERERLNVVILKHATLLREAFTIYATQTAAASGGGGGGGAIKRKGGKRGLDDLAGSDLDYIGFYRFCSDCKVVNDGSSKADDATVVATNSAGMSEGLQSSSGEFQGGKANLLTKGECHKLFVTVNGRFDRLRSGGKQPSAHGAAEKQGGRNVAQSHFDPGEFMAAIVIMAMRRYGPKMLPKPTVSPHPTADIVHYFLVRDVAPGVGRGVSEESPFMGELMSPYVQTYLQKKRKVLVPIFEHFAGLDGDGTMQLDELHEALRGLEFYSVFPRVTPALVEEAFAHVTNSVAQPVGNESMAAPPAIKDESGAVGSEEGDDAEEAEAPPEPSMIYSDFETFLAAIAAHTQPSPFVALSTKVQALVDRLMPKLVLMVKKIEKIRAAELSQSVAV